MVSFFIGGFFIDPKYFTLIIVGGIVLIFIALAYPAFRRGKTERRLKTVNIMDTIEGGG